MSINFYIKATKTGRAPARKASKDLLFINIMLFARSPEASKTQ